MSEGDGLSRLRVGICGHQSAGVLAREGEENFAGGAKIADDFEDLRSQAHAVLRDRDRGNSSINRPNAFTLSTVWAPVVKLDNRVWNYLLNRNQFTVLGNVSSGDEQNITANTVLNGDSLATSRPLYIGRNTARTPNVYQFDIRYTRSFFTLWEKLKPQFFIEANNVFNHPNITTLNTTATVNATTGIITANPTFAPVSTLLEGRIVQLAVKVDW